MTEDADPEKTFSLDELLAKRARLTTRCGHCGASFDGSPDAGRDWLHDHHDACSARPQKAVSPRASRSRRRSS